MRLLVAYSSLAHLGFIVLGIVAFDVQAGAGRGAADGQPRHRRGRRLRDRRDHQPHRPRRPHRRHRRPGRRRAAPGRRLPDRGDGLAGHPRLQLVRRRVPDPHGRLPPARLARGARLHRHRLRRRLHAAPLPERDERPAARRHGLEGRAARARPRDPAAPGRRRCSSSPSGPKAIVGATTASIERAVAPAQVAAGRPADQIRAVVEPNPPADALPLPGDPVPETTTAPTEATP